MKGARDGAFEDPDTYTLRICATVSSRHQLNNTKCVGLWTDLDRFTGDLDAPIAPNWAKWMLGAVYEMWDHRCCVGDVFAHLAQDKQNAGEVSDDFDYLNYALTSCSSIQQWKI